MPQPAMPRARGNPLQKFSHALDTIQHRDGNRQFIPRDKFDELLTVDVRGHSLLYNVIEAILDDSEDRDFKDRLYDARGIIVERYPVVLSVLVWVSLPDKILHFVGKQQHDGKLPILSIEDLAEISPDLVQSSFMDVQHKFLVPRITEELRGERFRPKQILPYLSEEPIPGGRGNFGTVSQVTIHPYYDGFESPQPSYALKRINFKDITDAEFTNETFAAQLLSYIKHPNIVPLLAYYVKDSQYQMLFPCANSNLGSYLATAPAPTTRAERLQFFKEISLLCDALHSIHNVEFERTNMHKSGFIERQRVRHYGHHCDIKPENILFFEAERSFMIADFGLAQFVRQTDPSQEAYVRPDFTFGHGTYRAPECRTEKKMSRASDIWSLGCVLAQVVTFAVLGNQGVAQFAEKRTTGHYVGGDRPYPLDWYHGDNGQLKSEVREWFQILRARAESESEPLIGRLLGLIEKMLAPKAKDRPTAKDVDSSFSIYLEEEEQEIELALQREQAQEMERAFPRHIYANPSRAPTGASAQWYPTTAHTMPVKEMSFSRRVLTTIRNIGTSRANSVPKPRDSLRPLPSIMPGPIYTSPTLPSSKRKTLPPMPTHKADSPSNYFLDKTDGRHSPEHDEHIASSHIMNSNASGMGIDFNGADPDVCTEYRATSANGDSFIQDTQPTPKTEPVTTAAGAGSPRNGAQAQRPLANPSAALENCLGEVPNWDTLFIVDDTEHMNQTWSDARATLSTLAKLAISYDTDGVDMIFLNRKDYLKDLASLDLVLEEFDRTEPLGNQFLSSRLDKVLPAYVKSYAMSASPDQVKPLSIIIITNGEFNELDDFEQIITHWAQQLEKVFAPLNQLGIQFVLLNGSMPAEKRLQTLDDGCKGRDVVDMRKYNPQREGNDRALHIKCLCGGVIKGIDKLSS